MAADPLMRALDEIRQKRSMQAAEVVVRRAPEGTRCGWSRFVACHHLAIFEIRGAVRVRICGQHLDYALDYLVEPIPLADMDEHIGRHSSTILRKECASRPYRREGTRPLPIGKHCYECNNAKPKVKKCSLGCGRRTWRRCTCLAVVCYECMTAHHIELGAKWVDVPLRNGGTYRMLQPPMKGHTFAEGCVA